LTKSKRIFVSNRLPYSVNPATGEAVRGTGGLVSALLGVNLGAPFEWMGFETNEGVARQLRELPPDSEHQVSLRPVVIDKKLYESYYNGFCNDVLWPLFHYENENTFFARKHWESYQEANRRMADAILKAAGDHDTVWIHDFHFMLLPGMLKAKKPQLKVGFFLHVPFPSSEIFRQLPVRDEILKALVRCDLVGFHDHSYLRHFTVTLKSHLGIDSTFFKAQVENHVLHLGVYPISIDGRELAAAALSPAVRDREENFKDQIRTPFLILGVDRLDYTKGIELKLRGFYRLLSKYPELRGQVKLLQVAVPTRTKVRSYVRLKKQVDELVGTINGEFGQPGYSPVDYIFNSVSQTDLLALYRRAECLLVTSKRDGMNLVSMEYVVAKDPENPGVLILSEFVGAASILGQALLVNPWDEDSIADAIHTAHSMIFVERRARLKMLQEILARYSASQWAESFLADLELHTPALQDPVIHLAPDLKSWPAPLVERIAAAKTCYLITDYDGTLVSLNALPHLATISDERRESIRRLQSVLKFWILSGRGRDFLSSQWPENDVHMAAEHGAYFRTPRGEWINRIDSNIQSWYAEVKRVMDEYTVKVPLSFVESKDASIVWHYRLSPRNFAEYQAKKLDEELTIGFSNQPVSIAMGSKIVEAKALECNKGHFLKHLMESDPDNGALFLCLGDDRTDEDMFRLNDPRLVSIKVGKETTAAAYRVDSQERVDSLLQNIFQIRA